MSSSSRPVVTVPVWDPALRLFHWLLAATVAGAIVTGEIGGELIDWHARLGLATAGLLGFRLCWGLVGPETARFGSFIRGPAAIRAYLRGQWPGLGHSPLGALAVLALLALTGAQVATGLFSNDDISFQGPFAHLVGGDTSERLTGLHARLAWLVFAIVGVHLLAIAFYRWRRQEDLVTPMLTGRKALPHDHPAAQSTDRRRAAPSGLALLLSAVAGALVVLAASGALLPGERAAPSSSAQAAPAPTAPTAW